MEFLTNDKALEIKASEKDAPHISSDKMDVLISNIDEEIFEKLVRGGERKLTMYGHLLGLYHPTKLSYDISLAESREILKLVRSHYKAHGFKVKLRFNIDRPKWGELTIKIKKKFFK